MLFRTPNQIGAREPRGRIPRFRARGGALVVLLALGIVAGCAQAPGPADSKCRDYFTPALPAGPSFTAWR